MVQAAERERLAALQGLLSRGDWQAAMAGAQALHDELACTVGPGALSAEVALIVAKAAYNSNQFDRALEGCRLARAGAELGARPDLVSVAWVVTAAVEARLDRPVSAVAAIEQALAGLSDASPPAVRQSVYYGVAIAFQGLSLWRQSMQAWRGAVEAERASGSVPGGVLSGVNFVATAVMVYDDELGADPDAAAALLAEIAPLAADIEAAIPALKNPWWILLSRHAAGSVARRLGDHARALAMLEGAAQSLPDAPAVVRGVAMLELALARSQSGDEPGGRADAEWAVELLRQEPAGPTGAIALPVLNGLWRAEQLAGRHGDALALLDQLRCRTLRCHWAVLDAQAAGLAPRVAAKTLTLLNADLREANAGLSRHLEDLSRVAQTDPLTGALNRRGLEAAFGTLQSSGRALALALLDLDHFKAINDGHSHLIGDQVLRALSRELTELLRAPDCVGRFGGEEFALLLSGVGEIEALVVVERLRRHVEAAAWHRVAPGVAVTFSAGVVAVRHGETFSDAVSRADVLLYAAKREGRNLVRPPLPAQAEPRGPGVSGRAS